MANTSPDTPVIIDLESTALQFAWMKTIFHAGYLMSVDGDAKKGHITNLMEMGQYLADKLSQEYFDDAEKLHRESIAATDTKGAS